MVVVEDDGDTAFLLATVLRRMGAREVTVCATAEEALERCAAGLPDLVTTDDRLPGMSGSELVEALAEAYAERCPPIVMISATVDRAERHPAVRARLLKPYKLEDLRAAVESALGSRIELPILG